ncbi:MAG: putative glycoside hydrolase [Patescibacteria group bacterium]
MNKIKFCILSFLLLFVAQGVMSQYPVRSAVYWTAPVLSLSEARNLSLYSIVIIDEENLLNNPEALELMKKLNKNLKLICYSNPMELFKPAIKIRQIQTALLQEITEKYPQWLLKNSTGEKTVFYKGMVMLNLSRNCPRVNGKNCAEYLAEKQLLILESPIWDGYFMDNGGGNIAWVNAKIDSNNDGVADDSTFLDRSWSTGIYSFLSLIKNGMNKDRLLLANKGTIEFMDILDGRIFERFPNDYLGSKKDFGWHKSMSNARHTGKYTIFTVELKDLMFGLASALLTDNVYIAVGQDNPVVHQEFKVDLGNPLGSAQKNDSCYFRLYQKGRVEVFPSARRGKITISK